MRRLVRSRTTRFGGRGYKPARSWIGSSVAVVTSAGGTSSQANVLAIEAPTLPAVLTAAPPDDITILAVKGYFFISAATAPSIDIALMVVDSTWTPSASWLADSDKRLLWWKSFTAITAPLTSTSQMSWFDVDIKPKVRLEDGKRLVLVQWQEAAGTCQTTAKLRLLTQRAGRR